MALGLLFPAATDDEPPNKPAEADPAFAFCLETPQAELERAINHPTFAFPTSVARYKNRLSIVSSQFATAGSPAAVSGTQPPVVPFWVTQISERIVTTIPLESQLKWLEEAGFQAVA